MSKEPHLCESCGKDCEELTKISSYGGQDETGWLCEECLDD